MPEKIYTYESDEIEVTWDKFKCIHAKECVHGLPGVFNIDEKPWIQPGKSAADKVAKVITKCPTGALQFKRKDGGEKEPIPRRNDLTLVEDGPVYLKGNLNIKNLDGEVIAEETRAAFCRCGKSTNKPYCDNSHIKAEFKAGTEYNPERLLLEETDESGGELSVTIFPNAPFVVEGNYTLNGSDQAISTQKKMSFCRCGASSNKPFCDGSHKEAEFRSEE
ncbi:MAG: CDGSH iron-sulfur domain-containing protein [Balneolaceae bacterium]|nr:CDGSH iron-sulfur domain-containing protein [Balneolaceae bacterium]MBO6545943.1 CDGSH iron-sulfur domain-containing protein [Balneolaceae bacterium]MBO6647339.1 CDGSH iron-sulfur domain-containing protein [Balneolaceae bacterium]